MNKLSKRRIKRILERHCVMVRAEHFRPRTDEYGDVSGIAIGQNAVKTDRKPRNGRIS